jgi:hypothetical protein
MLLLPLWSAVQRRQLGAGAPRCGIELHLKASASRERTRALGHVLCVRADFSQVAWAACMQGLPEEARVALDSILSLVGESDKLGLASAPPVELLAGIAAAHPSPQQHQQLFQWSKALHRVFG